MWNAIKYAVYICTYPEKGWLVFFIVSLATNITNFQIECEEEFSNLCPT